MIQKHCRGYISSLILMLSLAACSYNPLSDNNHLTGSAEGAVIGGAAGLGTAAALGATKPVVLGLATLGGASIGYYVTTLRFSAAGIYQVGGQVYTQGDYVTIEIPSNRIFDDNSAELLPEAEPVLKSAANVLKRFCCQSILVSGNTSGFSGARYERTLSQARAREVAAFLWAQGINNFQTSSTNLRHLNYVGYGNYFPIASDLTNNGIRMNSRIQITAYPTKDQLLIDEKRDVFNNVASLNDEPHLSADSTYIPESLPSGEVLSEKGTTRVSDVKGVFVESAGRNPVSLSNEPQTVEKHRVFTGYKGETMLPGEG